MSLIEVSLAAKGRRMGHSEPQGEPMEMLPAYLARRLWQLINHSLLLPESNCDAHP
jgi:hypothetical protein